MTDDVHEPSTEEHDENLAPSDVPEDDADTAKPEAPLQRPDELGWWQMVRRFFFMTKRERLYEREWRIQQLTDAIEHQPDVAVNYLLRGELYLAAKDDEQAKHDFEKAQILASAQYEKTRFGFAQQAIQDKAIRYLNLLSD